MASRRALGLLEGCGIELEYMIVDSKTLDVLSLSDELLRAAAGRYTNDYSNDGMGWSNEFVCHVLEVKNNDPLPSLQGLSKAFHSQVTRINSILAQMGGRLMPSGMHPWMNPRKETKIWPHRYRTIYETYDRIFNCRRHGWANVQSMHINLSFKGDKEFSRLHAAIRLLIPLLPALAASSPVINGSISGLQDTRLLYYGRNQRKVPSVMGRIIPEPVFTKSDYHEKILGKMYRDIKKFDNSGILQYEWLNSRGVIPRYERNAMEIRVVDTQECPLADIAVAEAVISVIKLLVAEHWSSLEEQMSWEVKALLPIFNRAVRHGDESVIPDERYLRMFGFSGAKARAAGLWQHLISEASTHHCISRESVEILELIMQKGTLSRRILTSLGDNPSQKRLRNVYGKLCDCLAANTPFAG